MANSKGVRRRSEVLLLVLSAALTLFLVELVLRALDARGLGVQLSNFATHHSDDFSYYFHHRKGASDSAVDVSYGGGGCDLLNDTTTILFLGDSWMADPGIPAGFAAYLSRDAKRSLPCIRLVNGGTSSYSPSPITLQGEYLATLYRPDLIVIYVDETDLMDESVRYRPVSLYDRSGELDRLVPGVAEVFFAEGFSLLHQQPVYLLRLVEKVYFTRVLMPRLRQKYVGSDQGADYDLLLSPQLASEPYVTHADEIEYFRTSVRAMLRRLSVSAGGADRVLLATHPHYLSLVGTYNDVVPTVLREEAADAGIVFYDASVDIAEMYGSDPSPFYRWPEDPFSHLTSDAYRVFGYFLAQRTLPHISDGSTWIPSRD